MEIILSPEAERLPVPGSGHWPISSGSKCFQTKISRAWAIRALPWFLGSYLSVGLDCEKQVFNSDVSTLSRETAEDLADKSTELWRCQVAHKVLKAYNAGQSAIACPERRVGVKVSELSTWGLDREPPSLPYTLMARAAQLAESAWVSRTGASAWHFLASPWKCLHANVWLPQPQAHSSSRTF